MMIELIQAQLRVIIAALPTGATFDDWYHDAADITTLVGDRGSVAFAWGYLRGVAEAWDVTVLEMLEEIPRCRAMLARKRR